MPFYWDKLPRWSLRSLSHRRRHVIWRFQGDTRFSDSKSNQPRPKAVKGRASVAAYVMRFPSVRARNDFSLVLSLPGTTVALWQRRSSRYDESRLRRQKMAENVKACGRRQIVAQMRGDIWRYRNVKSFSSFIFFSLLF